MRVTGFLPSLKSLIFDFEISRPWKYLKFGQTRPWDLKRFFVENYILFLTFINRLYEKILMKASIVSISNCFSRSKARGKKSELKDTEEIKLNGCDSTGHSDFFIQWHTWYLCSILLPWYAKGLNKEHDRTLCKILIQWLSLFRRALLTLVLLKLLCVLSFIDEE